MAPSEQRISVALIDAAEEPAVARGADRHVEVTKNAKPSNSCVFVMPLSSASSFPEGADQGLAS